jgi:serine phosphatase RsbU (regulator of sigma subunit)/PAS domain-containing protein
VDDAAPPPHRSPPQPLGRPGEDDGGVGPDLVRFLEGMPAAFCFLDREWHVRYVNAEAERLIGRPREGMLGMSLWEAFPRPLGTDLEADYRRASATGEPVTVQAFRRRPSAIREGSPPSGPTDAARQTAARASLLAQVSAELSGAVDTESALGRLAQLVVPALTDGCIVTVVDRDGRARDVGSWHADPQRRPLMAEYTQVRIDSLPADSPVALALRAGTPVTESVPTIVRMMRPGPARNLLRAIGPASAVVLPLTAEGRTVGVLTLYQDAGRVVGGDDLDTARLVAEQAARAVARVHRQSQQAQLVEGLQRSLLTDPPEIIGMQIVVRYVPAAEAARVGGDWYDAFLQRDGTPVIVIGDVVGHDTEAAAAMGQLRGLLRGIAHHSGAGPAEALRGLDEAMTAMHTDTLATAVIARFETAEPAPGGSRCSLRWANAGHPPPMVLTPDGQILVLGGPMGDLMLGVDPSAARAEPTVDVAEGATVLLYTDGLVERRDSTVDEGIARLAEQLRELGNRPLDELCDALLERLLHGTPQDDVAIVAVRLAPSAPAG